MAEDFDIEALLEAPYNSSKNGLSDYYNKIKLEDNDKKRKKRSRSKERRRSKSREKKHSRRSRSKERKSSRRDRSRSNSRDKYSRSRERRHRRSRSKEKSRDRSKSKEKSRDRSKSKERLRDRSKSKERLRGRSRDGYRRRYDDDRYSKRRSPSYHREDRILEEADRRTVFCMQLAARVREIDLEEFFSKAGKVHEVRLIMDNKTRKHKGIAYIEFRESSSVPSALQLNGQKLCGYPISIQPTHAEKNKAALSNTSSVINPGAVLPTVSLNQSTLKKQINEPLRLYVGSLHFNVSEDMLKSIFEPFGVITKVELMRDTETLRSKGYGFITFANSNEAKKALEQMNGYELAGRPMKVNYVVERGPDGISTSSNNGITLDSDELDRTGIDLGTKGRLQLMAKLAEGTGIQLPKYCIDALNQYTNPTANKDTSVSTQCFLLNNLFDPETEPEEDWPEVIKEEVLSECRLHGGASHIYVDVASKGNVYVKATSIAAAVKCVTALHGRWFSGKLVTAAYVPASSYHQLFPDSLNAITPL